MLQRLKMPSHRLPLLFLLHLLAGGVAHAHPLLAEPVNHPFVFTFDQFFLSEDPDEHLVNGGFLLLAELDCTACHSAPAEWQPWLAPRPAPRLAGAASRMDADLLWLFLRSPQLLKKGTQMPGLFSGAEGDEEKVEALVEYLSATPWRTPALPAGDAERGRVLYHQTGCVACHEPATDFLPAGASADDELERPGNASVPITLADVWQPAALAAFLHQPLSHRPSGRMPDMHLSPQEAADIAAYLHLGRTTPQSTLRAALGLAPQGRQRGREVFQEMRCASCHEPPETNADPLPQPPPPPPTLRTLRLEHGCMAERQATGTPRYDLNDLQKRALRLALISIQSGSTPDHLSTPAAQADWHMTRLNCYACHDRAFKGGPEDPRALYFSRAGPTTSALSAPTAHLPPSLDGAGTRLTRAALMEKLLSPASGHPPHTRMPLFGPAQVQPLVDLLIETEKAPP